MKKKRVSASKLKFWIFLVFLILSTLFSISLGIFDIDQTAVEGFLKANPYFSKLVFFGIMTIAVATTLPVNLIALAGLFVFDFYILLLMVSISILLGVVIMYFIAKQLGEKGFEEYAGINGTRINVLHKLMKEHRYPLMTLLSFVYFFPSNMAGVTAAFTGTEFPKFFVISFFGNAINIIFFIILAKGIMVNNFLISSVSLVILILNTLVPLVIYRKNIKNVFRLVFGN